MAHTQNTWICRILVKEAEIAVLEEVLDVAHLVVHLHPNNGDINSKGQCVHRDEVLLVDSGALLDPEVLAVVEIPGRGMAGQVAAVSGLLDDAACKDQEECTCTDHYVWLFVCQTDLTRTREAQQSDPSTGRSHPPSGTSSWVSSPCPPWPPSRRWRVSWTQLCRYA